MRHFPTKCEAIRRHRNTKITKKSTQIPPFWWVSDHSSPFCEFGRILATSIIKQDTLSMLRCTTGEIFVAGVLGQYTELRRQKNCLCVGLFHPSFTCFVPVEAFYQLGLWERGTEFRPVLLHVRGVWRQRFSSISFILMVRWDILFFVDIWKKVPYQH